MNPYSTNPNARIILAVVEAMRQQQAAAYAFARCIESAAHGLELELEGALPLPGILPEPPPMLEATATAPQVTAQPENSGPPKVSENSAIPLIETVVIEACGLEHGVSLSSVRKDRTLVEARWIAFYVTSELTRAASTQIARHYKRDHSTVLHGLNAISERMKKSPALRDFVAATIATCRSRFTVTHHDERAKVLSLVTGRRVAA